MIMKVFKTMTVLVASVMLLCSCSHKCSVESVNANEFEHQIHSRQVQLVDVRTLEEYASGHIVNAINIDVQKNDFPQEASKRLKKNVPTYVYCRSGKRSMEAADILCKEGYQVVNLRGGIKEWCEAGLPTI